MIGNLQSMASVGAGLSKAQFQVSNQGQALKEQQPVTDDLGTAALKLISTAMLSMQGHDLDILA